MRRAAGQHLLTEVEREVELQVGRPDPLRLGIGVAIVRQGKLPGEASGEQYPRPDRFGRPIWATRTNVPKPCFGTDLAD
ncbi:hypothetical protein GCM10009742_48690 [Kribbella karoonensis]|uniref:Uncharacterized protein n=1 Tax=Kribbella karoonensis TaxID=324851 RepID=A0ABN2E4C9_9ACTN